MHLIILHTIHNTVQEMGLVIGQGQGWLCSGTGSGKYKVSKPLKQTGHFRWFLKNGSRSGGSRGTPPLPSPWTNVTVASSVGSPAVSTSW